MGYCHFRDFAGEEIDRGMAVFFPSPHSFTGEDVVELYPHGNPFIIERLLETIVELGGRPARAGEFSERAFVNAKQDLVQLEATADLISASSERATQNALVSMRGEFSGYVNRLVEDLIATRVVLEASFDFSEEDLDAKMQLDLLRRLNHLASEIDNSIECANNGIKLYTGVTVALVGRPNVGKSSLLNALAGSEQAIVTDIPGTTRDIVQISIEIDGIEFIVKDTAGLRESADLVERVGIERTMEAAQTADLVILMQDGLNESDIIQIPSKNVIQVINKIDLLKHPAGIAQGMVYISALTREGLQELKSTMVSRVNLDAGHEERPVTARRRHLFALQDCQRELRAAIDMISGDQATELAAENLRKAQQALEEITGRFTSEDLLGRIFSEFCIGK